VAVAAAVAPRVAFNGSVSSVDGLALDTHSTSTSGSVVMLAAPVLATSASHCRVGLGAGHNCSSLSGIADDAGVADSVNGPLDRGRHLQTGATDASKAWSANSNVRANQAAQLLQWNVLTNQTALLQSGKQPTVTLKTVSSDSSRAGIKGDDIFQIIFGLSGEQNAAHHFRSNSIGQQQTQHFANFFTILVLVGVFFALVVPIICSDKKENFAAYSIQMDRYAEAISFYGIERAARQKARRELKFGIIVSGSEKALITEVTGAAKKVCNSSKSVLGSSKRLVGRTRKGICSRAGNAGITFEDEEASQYHQKALATQVSGGSDASADERQSLVSQASVGREPSLWKNRASAEKLAPSAGGSASPPSPAADLASLYHQLEPAVNVVTNVVVDVFTTPTYSQRISSHSDATSAVQSPPADDNCESKSIDSSENVWMQTEAPVETEV